MKILINIPLAEKSLEKVLEVARDAAVRVVSGPGELVSHLESTDILFVRTVGDDGKFLVPPEALLRAPKLKWIQFASAGFEPYRGLRDTPIIVTTGKGIHGPAIAEHVLSLMLYFSRDLKGYLNSQQDHRWDRRVNDIAILKWKTLGIIGYGALGRALGLRARAFEMRVCALRRETTEVPPEVDERFSPLRLREMLQVCDHVALMVPLTEETRGMIGARELEWFRPGSYLYNVARGGIVDERALLEKLDDGTLAGAALDVFEKEPLPAGHPLWSRKNVVITPHMGGTWNGLWEATLDRFCENLRRFLSGEPLQHLADFEKGY